MMFTGRYSGPPTPTVVVSDSVRDLGEAQPDPFRRRVACTGYPVAETIRLGTPIACVECGGVGGTLRKVSDSPAVYAHDHAPHPPRRSLMTWRRHLALRS